MQRKYYSSPNGYAAHNKISKERYAQTMIASAKRNARKKNVPFSITAADINIPDICPYLQKPLTILRTAGRQKYNPSLDKIIPELGYVPDNIQVISNLANKMKQDATLTELVEFATNTLKIHGTNPIKTSL